MNRRDFLYSSAALALASSTRLRADSPQHQFPERELRSTPYIEETPVPEYHHAPQSAYEAFRDMKFGVRIHWGIYSIWHRGAESWPYLPMSFADRQAYNDLYKTWNPAGFDADAWMDDFRASGLKMFAFTSKHHEGFSMFDTKTSVKSRVNWTAEGGRALKHATSLTPSWRRPSVATSSRSFATPHTSATSKSIYISRILIGTTPTSAL